MKNINKCVLWILLLSMLICLSGCEDREKAEEGLSVFELHLREEERTAIDEAWANSAYGQSDPLPEFGRRWVCIEDGYIYGDPFKARYYGTYNDCVV